MYAGRTPSMNVASVSHGIGSLCSVSPGVWMEQSPGAIVNFVGRAALLTTLFARPIAPRMSEVLKIATLIVSSLVGRITRHSGASESMHRHAYMSEPIRA